jgi:hypothetical protein
MNSVNAAETTANNSNLWESQRILWSRTVKEKSISKENIYIYNLFNVAVGRSQIMMINE